MALTGTPDWIALDWGTTNLRGWAMQGSALLAEASSKAGMSSLDFNGFAPALEALLEPWNVPTDTPILACGMVGSRQGWQEAPYRAVPCTPLGEGRFAQPPGSRPVRIIAGLKQAAPPDVMRGEETQIAGFVARNPGWDGVLCLPGTHTKWAEISAGEVVSFQTFMSGELYALLSTQSVLRHSLTGPTEDAEDSAAFEAAVADAIARPERLAARLFSLRASDLLEHTAPGVARARLSGLLLGAELAAARPYWLGRQIALIGAPEPSRLYAAALKAQGVPAMITDASAMTRAGLTAAWRLLKGSS
ncbi:MAG: 2-dehydro-3-deoxygalactonokinase [Pseudomonadota bacterium]